MDLEWRKLSGWQRKGETASGRALSCRKWGSRCSGVGDQQLGQLEAGALCSPAKFCTPDPAKSSIWGGLAQAAGRQVVCALMDAGTLLRLRLSTNLRDLHHRSFYTLLYAACAPILLLAYGDHYCQRQDLNSLPNTIVVL